MCILLYVEGGPEVQLIELFGISGLMLHAEACGRGGS